MANVNSLNTDRNDRRYIAATMTASYLDPEKEKDLARRWRDHQDEDALSELIESHARLAVRMAWDFRRSGMPLGDLIQEGNIGLAQAAARFDPERNVRFSTYAGWWIMAEIQDYILRNQSIVRFATTPLHRSLFFKLRRLRSRMATNPDGTLPAVEKERLAKELDVPMAEIERIDGALARGDQSLNATREDDDTDNLQDSLPDPGPSPEEVVMDRMDRGVQKDQLFKALDRLNPRERQIIVSRFLDQKKHVTLAEIGEEFGVSKERVRQLEGRALTKLKGYLKETMGEPAASH